MQMRSETQKHTTIVYFYWVGAVFFWSKLSSRTLLSLALGRIKRVTVVVIASDSLYHTNLLKDI